jgi:hypothetical protein
MMPDNELSSRAVVDDLLAPDISGRPTLLTDYERGGIALQDPSQGLNVREWTAQVVLDDVRVYPSESPGSYTTVITVPGITEISLSFDQNMNPTLAYMVGSQAFLYWYDSVPEMMVTTELDAGVYSPFLAMDDKRDNANRSGTNDILLFYLLNGGLYFRQQRDRFTIEYPLAEGINPAMRIFYAGMAVNLRVKVELRIPLD